MNDLSIIIVSWNTKDYLLNCIESILCTGRKETREVIVIDNGSQDGSAVEVKKAFPMVRLIENSENLGFAKAANQGLKISSGRYAFLLNPDTQVKEGTTEKLFIFMEDHLGAGVAGAQLLNGDGSKQNSIANFPSLTTELLNKSLLRWLFPNKYPGKGRYYSDPIEVDSVIGACIIVRKQAMEQVGLLDEDYFLFLEETDWCLRIKKAGWKIYHVPEAQVYHFQGQSAEKDKKRAKVEYYRSRYHFFEKNGGSLRRSILLIGLMIRLWVDLVFAAATCLITFFGIKKWRRRLSTDAYLVWWHLRLCPETMGLKPVK
jgi:GT2 family glycosyltransferase